MASGEARQVEDLGGGKFRVTTLPGAPAIVFHETVDTAADLPPASERPAGWTIFNRETNSTVTNQGEEGSQSWGSGLGGVSETYSGVDSHQTFAADLELTAAAGETLPETSFLAAIMGNLLGDALTKTGNYLAGIIGALSVTGVKAAKMGVAGVMGIISDGVTDADAAVLAVLDGDSAVTTTRAMFGVKKNNSTPGSDAEFGLDLKGEAHDGFSVLGYTKAAARLDNDVAIITGAGAPVDGTTGDNVAGPGSLYIDITAGDAYLQTSLISTPVWKLVTRAA